MTLHATDRDPSADPGVDFYRFANGGWLDANPIPAGYGSWGSFEEVSRRNEVVLRELLERADGRARGRARPAARRRVRRRARPRRDRGRRDRADRAAAGGDRGRGRHDELLALLPLLHRRGIFALFGWDVTVDHDDSSRNLLWLVQAAARAARSRDVLRRGAGRRRPARRLRRARRGAARSRRDARGDARAGRRGAGVRDASRRPAPARRGAARPGPDAQPPRPRRARGARARARPAGLPGRARRRRGRERQRREPRACWRGCTRSSRTPTPATLRAYLTFTVVRTVADALPAHIDDEDFEFYGRRIRGQQEQHERVKRVIDAIGADLGEALAAALRRTHLPAGGQGTGGAHGRGDRRGDARLDPDARVDGRGDARARGGQARRDARQDRLPRPLARLVGARDRPRLLRREPAQRHPLRARPPARRSSRSRSTATSGRCPPTSSTPTTTRRSTRSWSRRGSCSRRCSTRAPTTPSTSAASAW